MKKHLSVFMLFSAGCTEKILLVCGGSAVLQLLIFRLFSRTENALEPALDEVLWPFRVVTIAALAAVFLILLLFGTGKNTHPEYFLRRLNISEREYCVQKTLYGAAMFWVFFAFRLLTYLLAARLYYAAYPAAEGPQTLAMAFCRNAEMHFLLPFEDKIGICNLFLLPLALGAETGCRGLSRNNVSSAQAAGLGILVGLAGLMLCFGYGSNIYGLCAGIALIFFVCKSVGQMLWRTRRKEAAADEE